MLMYFKSTSLKRYTVEGVTIPAYNTGKWLEVDTGTGQKILANPVIRSLVKSGGILKSDTEPSEHRAVIGNDNAALALENARLKEQLAQAEARAKLSDNPPDNIAESLRKELVESNKAVEEAKAAAKAAEDAKAALEAEAKEELAKMQAKIDKLEKQAKKDKS